MNIPSIAFMRGEAADQSGRTIEDYFLFTDAEWEACHNHMQWAFPTRTKSKFNPDAPVIPEDYFFFEGTDSKLEGNLLKLLGIYLKFLGFEISINEFDDMRVTVDNTALARHGFYWMRPYDHNHLRITRMIECLKIFMPDYADDVAKFFIFELAATYPDSFAADTIVWWAAAWQNRLPNTKLGI